MRLLTAVSGVRVPQQAPEKHLMKGAFFLPCFGTRTPRASRAFGCAEQTLRTPHWTRSAHCAAIAIPSLRSLRGFESLRGPRTKIFDFRLGLFQAPEKHLMKGAFFLALFEDKNPARLIYARSEGTTYASMRIERSSRGEYCSPSFPNKERIETNGDGVKPGSPPAGHGGANVQLGQVRPSLNIFTPSPFVSELYANSCNARSEGASGSNVEQSARPLSGEYCSPSNPGTPQN